MKSEIESIIFCSADPVDVEDEEVARLIRSVPGTLTLAPMFSTDTPLLANLCDTSAISGEFEKKPFLIDLIDRTYSTEGVFSFN